MPSELSSSLYPHLLGNARLCSAFFFLLDSAVGSHFPSGTKHPKTASDCCVLGMLVATSFLPRQKPSISTFCKVQPSTAPLVCNASSPALPWEFLW